MPALSARSGRQSPIFSHSSKRGRDAAGDEDSSTSCSSRLEHYVDVGLLGRRELSHTADTVLRTVVETHRAVQAWRPILDEPQGNPAISGRAVFWSTAGIFAACKRTRMQPTESLIYFAKGFELVGRGDWVTRDEPWLLQLAFLRSKSRIAEIDPCLTPCCRAKTDSVNILFFQGAAVSNREFLVRVRPEICSILLERLKQRNKRQGRRRRAMGGHKDA